CEGVTNVVANDITAEGATISWTAPAGQNKWEISYGIEGVVENNGTKIIVENTPVYTITGLESDFPYDVYVRSICQEGVYSAWSTKGQFRTTREGINTASADNVKVQIYPNPANSEATVTVDGITGEAEFVLADMNGRIIVTETINCEGSLVKTINVSNLAKGAYFVHIYNNDFNTTRKLIVK
ncbi:MAG: T9SS type A sorting domain-containing protein, partial [Bacteroidales bacterium]|nr:T9SS type A sorting domain-containing protein [Bacteroidales bacterium]